MPCAKPCGNCVCAASKNGGAAAPLPKRNKSQDERTPLLWQTTPAAAAADDVEGAALPRCERHNRAGGVCCRDLKGTDDRSLISPETIRDYVIGASDGLCVPFGLSAGLSSVGSSKLVVVAGLAELISGAVSMGIGGFLSAQAEGDVFKHQHRVTSERVERSCQAEMEREVLQILEPYGVPDELAGRVAVALRDAEARKAQRSAEEAASLGLTPFLLRLGQGMEPVSTLRSLQSAINIGVSYALGGLIPLLPYMFIAEVRKALYASVLVTGIVLVLFGIVKHRLTGGQLNVKAYTWSALSTLAVGGLAAAASWAIVSALEKPDDL